MINSVKYFRIDDDEVEPSKCCSNVACNFHSYVFCETSCGKEINWKRILSVFSDHSIFILLFLLLFSDSHNLPRKPPLDLILGQAQECLKLMSDNGLGACAFASVEEYM